MVRLFLFALMALIAPFGVARANPPRPLVVIFPTGQDRLAPVAQKKETPDQVDDSARFLLVARVVRQSFDDEGVVDALLFSPETPTFRRALQEARIEIGASGDVEEADRLRIAAACGARYSIAVTTLLASESDTKATTLQMDAVEVRAGKTPAPGVRWKESIQVGGIQALQANRRGASDALRTAARTLVLRFLNGPLREFRLATPRPELLPQAPPPPSTPADTVDVQAQADQVRANGEALMRDGNIEEGIRTLRRAVNLAPRAVAPRAALIRAYLSARRSADAADEASRALSVTDSRDATGRQELGALLVQTLKSSEDPAAARQGYESLLRADPKNVVARLALADLLLGQDDLGAAEEHYRILRRDAPENREAAWGMARLLAGKGDYEAALKEFSGDAAARHNFATMLFLETAMRLANRLIQNRAAWQEDKLTREAFYTATSAQATKAGTLSQLLQGAPPAEGAATAVIQAHKHRLLAASLLSQAIANLLQYLESGETSAVAQSKILLDEFFVEMKEAGAPTKRLGT